MPLAGLSDPFLKIQIKHDYEVDLFILIIFSSNIIRIKLNLFISTKDQFFIFKRR